MCPQAKNDLKSCLQKKKSCQDTEKEFAKAEADFVKLIKDCALANEENEKINVNLEKEIKGMEQTLVEL